MIGDKLKELRKQSGISQEDVAIFVDVSKQYISEIERDNRNPSIKVLNKIAEYFQVTPSFFLDKEGYQWAQTLSEEIKKYLRKDNLDYLKVGLKAKRNNISADTLSTIIDAIVNNNRE